MRKDISIIFKSEITLPKVVQKKAHLAFEEIKNKEHDTMKNNTSEKRTSSVRELFKKAPVWAAAIILAICVLVPTSIGLAKGGFSLYQRMHQTTTEEWLDILADYSAIPADTCGYSRDLTEEEATRYEELQLAYQTTDISPKFRIRYVDREADVTGEGLIMRLDDTNLIIQLPAAPLSDEHLLELIDFEQNISYSMRRNNMVEDLGGTTVWKKMEDLTIKEIERYYLIYYGANTHTSGGYNRRLSTEERAQYDKLLAAYEVGSAHPQAEIIYIDEPEQFTGEHLAFCLSDGRYYLPEEPLSDEDILQIIDLDKKAYYSILQLNEQYIMGEREHMPRRE